MAQTNQAGCEVFVVLSDENNGETRVSSSLSMVSINLRDQTAKTDDAHVFNDLRRELSNNWHNATHESKTPGWDEIEEQQAARR